MINPVTGQLESIDSVSENPGIKFINWVANCDLSKLTYNTVLQYVEDSIARWHNADTDLELKDWLGITDTQYALFVENPQVFARFFVAARNQGVGYHLTKIEKGVFGELSKVLEEVNEAIDAENQGVNLMVLMELSDVIAAIDGYLKAHSPSTTLQDLVAMAEVTRRAFDSGERT